MQSFFIIVRIFLGLLCTCVVESKTGISEKEIDKLLEIKMETFIKKYDREIALLEKKIHSQENKIQSQEKKILSQEEKIRILEDKCSSLSGAEEERENFVSFEALNHGINPTLQKNPEQKTTNEQFAQKRIVPGKGLESCKYSSHQLNDALRHIRIFIFSREHQIHNFGCSPLVCFLVLYSRYMYFIKSWKRMGIITSQLFMKEA